MNHMYRFSHLTLAINLILFSSLAYADDKKPVPEVNLPTITIIADTDNYTVESTSSATGLDLDFKENPKSISVITEQRMQDQQLSDIVSIVKNTSGLSTLNFDGGRTEIHARGFEAENFSVDGLPITYGTYVDRAEFSSTAIYDKVEVVKGANGLMSGSGNPSASINLTRKHADSSDFSGEVSLNADKFGTYGTTIDVGSGLNAKGTVRGRVVLDYTDGDTYVDRESKTRKTAYAVIDADITDNTVLSVGAAYKDNLRNGTMWGGLPMQYDDGSRMNWDVSDSTGVDWQYWNDTTTEYFASINHKFNNDWKIKVNANSAKTEGDYKLLFAGDGVNKATGSAGWQSIYYGKTDTDTTNVSGELVGSFDTFGKATDIMIGANYNKYESEASSADDLTETPIQNIENWDGSYPEPKWDEFTQKNVTEIKENAVYASAKLQVTDPLSVILGTRVSNFTNHEVDYGSKYDIEHKSVWTPFVGLTYAMNNNISLFGSYTDTFKPQYEQDVNGDYLDPVVGSNIEIGIKSSNDNDTLQAQFSVFKIKQDNLAQEDIGKFVPGTADPNDPDDKGDEAYYEAEGAVSKGIDVELSGKFTDNMTASIGYTHFTAEDKDGKAINTENPDTLLKVFATYDMQNYVPGLTIGGGVNWSNGRYAMIENYDSELEEKYSEDAFTNVSLMAKYDYNENMDFQLNVDNLLNQKRVQSFAYDSITFAEPLSVKGKVTYRW